jgi:hypothetical protein
MTGIKVVPTDFMGLFVIVAIVWFAIVVLRSGRCSAGIEANRVLGTWSYTREQD